MCRVQRHGWSRGARRSPDTMPLVWGDGQRVNALQCVRRNRPQARIQLPAVSRVGRCSSDAERELALPSTQRPWGRSMAAEPFPDEVISAAWVRSSGKCECMDGPKCNHLVRPHGRLLSREAAGKDDSTDGWEAHHLNPGSPPTVDNCRILCIECHKRTSSYGTGVRGATEQRGLGVIGGFADAEPGAAADSRGRTGS